MNRLKRVCAKLQAYLYERVKLPQALAIIISAACLIVAAAYLLYWNDPNRKYDLARGGEAANQALEIEDEAADTTSPVTPEAAAQKIDYITEEIKALSGLNRFNPEDISDQNIQLAPSDQPSF